MAWELYLGPSGSEVLLPPPNWIGAPGDYPETLKKNIDSAVMLGGKVRYDFAGHSQRAWTLSWAELTKAQVNAMQTLADKREALRFWNGLGVNPAWAWVAVTEFAALPILSTFRPGAVAKYEAMMTLEEES